MEFKNTNFQYIDTIAIAKIQNDLGAGVFATHQTPLRVVRQCYDQTRIENI